MRNSERISQGWMVVCGLAIAVASMPFSPAFGAAEDWQIGLAQTDITPQKPVPMAGYASREAPFENVEQRLNAKAMAFEDSEGNQTLLLTADIIGFTEALSSRICKEITEQTGLPREKILLNGSHTHSAPNVRPSIAYRLPDETRAMVEGYTEFFCGKLVEIGVAAMKSKQPARLSWGSGIANFITNRREFTDHGVILGHNGRGPCDRNVPVLRVDGPSGVLRAVVFGAACHNTTLTGKNMDICGDYAGFAQACLQEAYPEAQVMFMIGCAGDANPYPRSTLEWAQAHGKELGEEVARVLGSDLRPLRGPLRTAFERVELPLRKFESREEIENVDEAQKTYRQFFVDGAMARLDAGKELLRTYSAPLTVWQFGDDLTLVGFCGETLVDYALFAERDLGPLNLWVAGYCNDMFGYLPPARVLAEGGYETRGLYVDAGLFTPGVEDVVMASINRLAAKVGRTPSQ